MPTVNIGMIITCVTAAFALLSIQFASIQGAGEAVGEPATESTIKRGFAFHSLSVILSGIFSVTPFMSYVTTGGIVRMTGVAARGPFYLASAFMLVIGFIKPIGLFFANIPHPVGYAAVLVAFAMIFGQGISEYQKVDFTNRECLVAGMSILIGVGIICLPRSVFENINPVAASILSNGLICGMIVAFLLEHVILRKTNISN